VISHDDDSKTRPTRPAVGPTGEGADTVVEAGIDREPLERGASIGRYTVLGVLGRGGMGVIYRAYDPELNRNVALKLLRVRKASAETAERARARMLREAQALARLSHPNVIAVYDAGTYEDDVFITMELVEGESLSAWLKKESRSREQLLDVFIAAGRGLAAAHDAGLVHRDFKPSNVMVGADGRVRVLDFGLAKAADNDSDVRPTEEDPPRPRHPVSLDSPLTMKGHIVGTPKYMAPEQLRGRQVDPRSDQFGFCVALFVALTGKFPFPRDDLVGLLEAMYDGRIREDTGERKLPAWLKRALHRGLAYDPDDRFASMRDLLHELGRDRLKRRHLAMYVGLAVIALAVTMLALGGGQRRSSVCPAKKIYLTKVWNRGFAGEIRAAFRKTGRPHAETTASHVSTMLESYAERWRTMRHAACIDTRERRARSPQLFDRGVRCLDRRRDQLAALTRLFRDAPTAAVVDRAVSAVGQLGMISDCGVDALLANRVKPPRDRATRSAVEGLRRRLDATRLAYRAGRLRQARREVKQVVADAEATGYEPVVAETLLLRAQVGDSVEDLKGAEAALRRAIRLAAAHRYDRVEAQAWVQLLWLVGYRMADHQRAKAIALAAQSAVARAGGDPVLRGQLLNNLGSVSYSRGDYDAAEKAFRKALELRIASRGKDHPDVASVLVNLGLVYYKRGEYAKALEYHRRAYRIRARVLGKTHPLAANSLNNLGIVEERQGRQADARRHYLAALKVRERLLGPDNPKLAAVLNNLGNIAFKQADYELANKYFHRALVLKEKAYGPNHLRLTTTLDNLAEVHMKRGDPRGALVLLQRSLAISTAALPANHPDLAYTLTNLGSCYRELGKPARAIRALERALKLRRSEKLPAVLLAQTRFELARALWSRAAQRPRARKLGAGARVGFEKAGKPGAKQAVAVKQWLASH